MPIFIHTQLFAYEFWVAGDANDEIGMFIVCLNDGVGGTVLSQFLMDGGEASASSFSQMQLFEEFTQTRIAVATGMDSFACPKIIKFDAAFCTAIADYLYHVWHDIHFYRLVLVISTVIVGINQTLFQCLIGIVVHHDRMLIVFWLVNILSDNHILQIVQCTPKCQMNRATKGFCLCKVVGVAILALRIEYDVDLSAREESFGMV